MDVISLFELKIFFNKDNVSSLASKEKDILCLFLLQDTVFESKSILNPLPYCLNLNEEISFSFIFGKPNDFGLDVFLDWI